MKINFHSAVFFAVFIIFSACGDDSGSGSDESQISMGDDVFVNSVDDLPNCMTNCEGMEAYVKEEKTVYVCKDGDWISDAESGESSSSINEGSSEDSKNSSESKQSCSSVDASSSSTVSSSSAGDSSSSEVNSSSSEGESSSSEVNGSSSEGKSSSSEVGSLSSATAADVEPVGYYADNCPAPAGFTCTNASPLPQDYLNQEMLADGKYGEILDTRDYQVYKVVTIGEGENAQTWMAQNLNLELRTTKIFDDWSDCFEEDCDEYEKLGFGRLYTWKLAMNDPACTRGGKECNSTGVVQGICPEGWHLPSVEEWKVLIKNVGGTDVAGKVLCSSHYWIQNGWTKDDKYGFSALPGGYRYYNGVFSESYVHGYFWSSTEVYSEYDYTQAYYMRLEHTWDNAPNYSNGDKQNAYSVRCLKDN